MVQSSDADAAVPSAAANDATADAAPSPAGEHTTAAIKEESIEAVRADEQPDVQLANAGVSVVKAATPAGSA